MHLQLVGTMPKRQEAQPNLKVASNKQDNNNIISRKMVAVALLSRVMHNIHNTQAII